MDGRDGKKATTKRLLLPPFRQACVTTTPPQGFHLYQNPVSGDDDFSSVEEPEAENEGTGDTMPELIPVEAPKPFTGMNVAGKLGSNEVRLVCDVCAVQPNWIMDPGSTLTSTMSMQLEIRHRRQFNKIPRPEEVPERTGSAPAQWLSSQGPQMENVSLGWMRHQIPQPENVFENGKINMGSEDVPTPDWLPQPEPVSLPKTQQRVPQPEVSDRW